MTKGYGATKPPEEGAVSTRVAAVAVGVGVEDEVVEGEAGQQQRQEALAREPRQHQHPLRGARPEH